MRLTLINQFYRPDLAPTGQLAADLAEHRAAGGDQVIVITSRGGYVPESGVVRKDSGENPRVIRLWTPHLGKTSVFNRLIDYGLFYLQAGLRMLTLPAQDVIISMTTPPFISWIAVLHRFLHRSTKLVLWNMDCYPEVLLRAGVIRGEGWIARLMVWLNRQLFRRLDRLICLDHEMEQLLIDRYSPPDEPLRSTVIPNWEPVAQFPADQAPEPWEPSIPLQRQADFVVLYLGNAGYGHRFETVLKAADILQDEAVAFAFVGGGERWTWLSHEAKSRNLANLQLHGYVAKQLTASVMARADCALITLKDEYLGVISPSKLHSNLAMGLPVIYVGPEGGNVDEAIRKFGCGVSLRHGDVDGMVSFIRRLRDDRRFLQALRASARDAYEEAYTDTRTLPRFDQVLDSLLS